MQVFIVPYIHWVNSFSPKNKSNFQSVWHLPVAVFSRNSSNFIKVAEVSCSKWTSLGGRKKSTKLFIVIWKEYKSKAYIYIQCSNHRHLHKHTVKTGFYLQHHILFPKAVILFLTSDLHSHLKDWSQTLWWRVKYCFLNGLFEKTVNRVLLFLEPFPVLQMYLHLIQICIEYKIKV